MKFSALKTPDAMGRELGERLRQARLNLNLTQEDLGLSAGISRYSVKKLEHGQGSVQDLMALLIALESTDQLDNLMPPQQISPIQLLKLQGRVRKRASGVNHDTAPDQTVNKVDKEEDLGW
ncbi:helix-turn-helix transcriptional regulator [Acinetobacter pullicarnis]|uniref:helix-turn-helix transcriptional regulator n=1 Tax=Acinetobacter pullicarnis TaxID=2576829 RepID=UPI00111FF4D7|nr:helix-turn-helix transcriptional regulator [Acinetobacter pullicarnis]